MFTSFDKALVAAIMAIIYMLNSFGLDIGIDETTVSVLISIATPILVYLVPNKNFRKVR